MALIGTIGLPGGMGLAADAPGVRARTLAFLETAVSAAAEMGMRVFGGMLYAVPGKFTGQRARKDELNRIADGLRRVAARAEVAGICLAIEPVNRYETYLVNTAQQAQVLVDTIGAPNVGLLLDTYHMNIEERGLAATLTRYAGSLRHLHLNESDRGTPGGGNVDWRGVFSALHAMRYDGVASIETYGAPSGELPVSTSIWRDLFGSADSLAHEGLAFFRKMERSERRASPRGARAALPEGAGA